MRQDLSTYQAKVEEKFDVSGMCENVMVTIATREKRLQIFSKDDEPKKESLFDDLMKHVTRLNDIWDWRKE